MKPAISVTDPARGWLPKAILATSDGTTNREVDAWAAGWYTARDSKVICRLLDGMTRALLPAYAGGPGGDLYGHRILHCPVTRHIEYDDAGLVVVEGATYYRDDAGRVDKPGRTVLRVDWEEMAAPLRTLPAWFLERVRACAAGLSQLDADEVPGSDDPWWDTDPGREWMRRQDDALDADGELVDQAWRNCRPDSRERLMVRADHEPVDLLELLAAGGAA
jgi:hypothetical protein